MSWYRWFRIGLQYTNYEFYEMYCLRSTISLSWLARPLLEVFRRFATEVNEMRNLEVCSDKIAGLQFLNETMKTKRLQICYLNDSSARWCSHWWPKSPACVLETLAGDRNSKNRRPKWVSRLDDDIGRDLRHWLSSNVMSKSMPPATSSAYSVAY